MVIYIVIRICWGCNLWANIFGVRYFIEEWDRQIGAWLLNSRINGRLLLSIFYCNGFLRTFIASKMLINDGSQILVILALSMILFTSFHRHVILACLKKMKDLMIIDFISCWNSIYFLSYEILYEFYYFVTSVNILIPFIE